MVNFNQEYDKFIEYLFSLQDLKYQNLMNESLKLTILLALECRF